MYVHLIRSVRYHRVTPFQGLLVYTRGPNLYSTPPRPMTRWGTLQNLLQGEMDRETLVREEK